MPTDDVILIGVGFLGDAVIDNHDGLVALHAPHEGFGNLPQVGRGTGLARQEASHLIMTEAALEQGRQPGSGGLSKRADEVVAVEVK